MSQKPKARECDAKNCEFFMRMFEMGRTSTGFGMKSKCFCKHPFNPGRQGLVSENDVCPKEL